MIHEKALPQRFKPQSGPSSNCVRGLLRCIGLALFIGLAACAATTPPPPPTVEKPAEKTEVARMFATILDNVHKMYLDEFPVAKLAVSGLSGLKKLEPAAAIRSGDNRIELLINGTAIGYIAPPQGNDADSWASAIEELIESGRKVSTKLAEAEIEKIYQVTIDSILTDLDRYTRYDGKLAGRRNRETREGFGGIGVSIVRHDDGVLIKTVTSDLPASRAGVIPGDIFVNVDGTPLRGLSLRRSVRLLRGPHGKPVQVTVQREHQADPIVLTISRTRIIPATVHYQARKGYAYLRMTGFNQDTTAELRQHVKKAVREFGGALDGLVIDLRGNPGGLLDQAVSAADLFLQEGRISTTRGRHPDSLQLFDASVGEIAQGIPIVLLVNGASASASEVLAAALQDHGRAVLIGSSSFGKGTVQTVIRLPNEGELILTWARLHSPLGFDLNRIGVVPTLCTSGEKEIAAVLDRSFGGSTSRRQLAASLPATNETRATAGKRCPWQPHDGDDVDIAVAKRILEKPELYKHALGRSAPTAGS